MMLFLVNFNPATVWFEQLNSCPNWNHLIYFNPATVWFEQFEEYRCGTLTYEFQSRNGLIWTVRCCSERSISYAFQSRNGLIWTTPEDNTDLNATTFQSRNGLIWTFTLVVCTNSASSFQSRNGLIWTFCSSVLIRASWFISIPQRSDLNFCVWTNSSTACGISIPQRSDLNVSYHMCAGLPWNDFNPATVWFELSKMHVVVTLHTSFQSRNGLIWTSSTVQEQIDQINFNPATVWFERWGCVSSKTVSICISIPQRSDLNMATFATNWIRSKISIPQRSDLNSNQHL